MKRYTSHFNRNYVKWVSPSPKFVGMGADGRVIGGRTDNNRLAQQAVAVGPAPYHSIISGAAPVLG